VAVTKHRRFVALNHDHPTGRRAWGSPARWDARAPTPPCNGADCNAVGAVTPFRSLSVTFWPLGLIAAILGMAASIWGALRRLLS
jgi:hypothetical protein